MCPTDDLLENAVTDECEGTRTWTIWGSSREELLRRVTLVFAEHVDDDDEVHIAYNAMQSGWRNHPPEQQDGTTHTELFFEYSALIVVRRRAERAQAKLSDALWPLIERLDRR